MTTAWPCFEGLISQSKEEEECEVMPSNQVYFLGNLGELVIIEVMHFQESRKKVERHIVNSFFASLIEEEGASKEMKTLSTR